MPSGGISATLLVTAHDWAKRDLASHAAGSAPGVDDVVDSIVVNGWFTTMRLVVQAVLTMTHPA